MIKKLYSIFEKYKISIVSSCIMLVVGIIALLIFLYFNNKVLFNNVNENNYLLKYDNSWKLKEKKDNLLVLKHKSSNSLLKIEIIKLDSEYMYLSIDDLMDEILYNLEKQNEKYKLLSKQEGLFTKNKVNGYKLLYETKSSQAMIATFKKSDKLIMMSYEASTDYFDILLDSVHNIIYHFDTKEKKFDLTNEIKLDTGRIEYTKEEKVEKLISKTKKYEIANRNYEVFYSIPDSFEMSSLNTTFHNFNLRGIDKGSLNMTVNIFHTNIYEYLDKESSLNLYNNYKIYKNNDDYKDFKESISKLESQYDSYIYKNSYYSKAVTYDNDFKVKEYNRKNEKMALIYALNKNHILVIEISASDLSIPKKLVDMIKIHDVKNYANYVKHSKKDGYLISELKRFNDSNKNKIDNITIKIPNKYVEYDKDNNLYESRYYGLNYDEEKEMYDYQVEYQLTNTLINDIDGQVKIANSSFSRSYGEYQDFVLAGEMTINNKNFVVYNGGYTDLGGIMFTNINRYKYYIHKKLLFYKMNSGGYLIIEISGNGKEISEELVKEVTNFVIEEKKEVEYEL